MSDYYHVLVKKIPENEELLYKDLSEKELKSLFVKPYKKGKDLFIDGVIHNNQSIQRITIIRTELDHQSELEVLQNESAEWIEEANRQPGPKIVSRGIGWFDIDITHRGENVTTNFIKKAPTNSPSLISKIIQNPWTVRIIGGLIVLIIAWLISKYFGLAL